MSPTWPAVATADARRCRLACVGLLLAAAAVDLWYLVASCPLDLAGDEAHYWEWARRLDISYYSKGPLVAWIIALSRWLLAEWSQRLVGTEALAVRGPALVLSVLTGLGLYTLARVVTGRPRVALAAVALTFTMPIFAAGAMLMTIDAPLACAWTWALVCVERALRRDSTAAWLATGILIALGILAKYTMVLIFPAAGLLMLSAPALRRQLKRPGPYAATIIGLAGFLPILLWNAQHRWVSFRHVAGQAGLAHGPELDPLGVIVYLAGQFAVVVVWLPGMLWALAEFWRRPAAAAPERHEASALCLLLFAAATPWAVFLLFSPITKVEPNWPLLSLIPATILLAMWIARRLNTGPGGAQRRVRRYVAAAAALGGVVVALAHRAEVLLPLLAQIERIRPSPVWEVTPYAKYDLTNRLHGWAELGRAVGEVVQAERASGREPFIMADNYQMASLIAFYTPGEPTVYSAQSALGGRLSQYDLWPNPVRDPGPFLGRPCVYVGSLHPALTGQAGGHAALPGLHEVRAVEYSVLGRYPVQRWFIFGCDSFAGFAPADAGQKPKY